MKSIKPAESYRDLVVWQRSIELAAVVYRLTRTFPREELYGLTMQLNRSSVSVASNIAEGQGRLTTGEFRQFLGMARGSNLEVQTQLEIAKIVELGDRSLIAHAESFSFEVNRMINAILGALRNRQLQKH